MATYTKTLVSLSIYVHGQNDPITVQDTADSAVASGVLASIEQGKTLHIPGDGSEMIVPYHAVIAVEVTKSTESVTKEDVTCVVDGESE